VARQSSYIKVFNLHTIAIKDKSFNSMLFLSLRNFYTLTYKKYRLRQHTQRSIMWKSFGIEIISLFSESKSGSLSLIGGALVFGLRLSGDFRVITPQTNSNTRLCSSAHVPPFYSSPGME